jgi:plastocyanin
MKTSYILAIAAIVIIGLIFFFSGSTDQKNDSQATSVETQNTQNTEDVENTESSTVESQEEESGVAAPDIEVTSEATSDTEVSPEPVSQTAPAVESTSHVFTLDSFSYGYSENEIRVKQGDTVTINLTNSAGFHDWVVDEFAAATEKINVGETTSVTFVADKAGTFEYYCSVGSHRQLGMVGNLVVE